MLTLDQLDREVHAIVKRCGGDRERDILRLTYSVYPDPETWNADHKVVNVISRTADEDGYRPGFAVDLVTRSICG